MDAVVTVDEVTGDFLERCKHEAQQTVIINNNDDAVVFFMNFIISVLFHFCFFIF